MEGRWELADLELGSLLAVARLGDEAYGLAVHEDLVARTGRGVSVAAVYAALRRMESAGLIRSWTAPPRPEPGGRSRKHFALEHTGLLALAEARQVRDRLWEGVEADPHPGAP